LVVETPEALPWLVKHPTATGWYFNISSCYTSTS
jgi:hypothetical protein